MVLMFDENFIAMDYSSINRSSYNVTTLYQA